MLIFPTSDDLRDELRYLAGSIESTQVGMNNGGAWPRERKNEKLALRALRKWYQVRGSYDPFHSEPSGFGK